ncbi:UDP-N-acetylmuramoyl-L-alanine--D-glutamate ligase [Acetonema longum]|uniref:UDP-N-acetylmuramoylalanine--D-glutamate ligase n=1 Tax=Acetonema longum DSM 6540 TaxID=1009370 RepID=F7NMZ0_9FIRM|nr:UDP-N-acetylmuramoyl-L-alanine--D-glutamate ligase [Acetonema longum]EGO62568.1 UDP-N-acetylmuramoyl-L-alanyl-D-glutamate synthetase [Acetonema longum DSM 6540]
MEFSGKKCLVLGAGISGISAANVLQELGVAVTLSDAKPLDSLNPSLASQIHQGIRLSFGKQDEALLSGQDYVIVSPGVSIYSPLVETAQRNGKLVMSEIEVAYQLCKAPLLAITGTNGKTTTTTLLGEMVKRSGRPVVVGGNIGLALSQEVRGLGPDGLAVAEISSFQLEGVINFKPHIAAILNLTPDHIDRHRNIATYQAMKERIFARQQGSDITILNYDDPVVREMKSRVPGQVVYFSRKKQMEEGIFLADGMIRLVWQGAGYDICLISDIKLKGGHNLENAMAAAAAAFLAGVSIADIAATLKAFAGVEHRIEPVATVQGVTYYNDSKATNPESTIKALEAFSGNGILLAGGRDKNTDLTEFMTLAKEKLDVLILFGEAKERFQQAAQKLGVKRIEITQTMEEAVRLAHSIARPPQVVLLSPACASYDMFNNYEERGRLFKELVHQLR